MWANLAHGLLMVPYSLTQPEYHSKFLTDIPWILGLSAAIFLLGRPLPAKGPKSFCGRIRQFTTPRTA
jgi:hypothetical protein